MFYPAEERSPSGDWLHPPGIYSLSVWDYGFVLPKIDPRPLGRKNLDKTLGAVPLGIDIVLPEEKT